MLRRSSRALHGRLNYPIGLGQRLQVGTELVGMEPANHIYFDPPKLRHQLDRDGYLYFKNKVPKAVISAALDEIGRQMLDNGWTSMAAREAQAEKHGFAMGIPFPKELWSHPSPHASANGPSGADAPLTIDGLPEGASARAAWRENPLPPPSQGFELTEPIKQALGGTSVMTVVRQIFGGGTQLLPHYELEMSPPGEAHGFSSPSITTCRGSKLLLCAWVPLSDITLTMGPMAMVKGSGGAPCYTNIRTTYGSYDIEAGDVGGDGCLTHHAEQLLPLGRVQQRDEFSGKMITVDETPITTTAFEAGDVVLSTVYTLRSFLTNCTDIWRVSGHTMWMMEGDDVGPDPRYGTEDAAGMNNWLATRDNKERYPRTMADARREWKILEHAESTEKAKRK